MPGSALASTPCSGGVKSGQKSGERGDQTVRKIYTVLVISHWLGVVGGSSFVGLLPRLAKIGTAFRSVCCSRSVNISAALYNTKAQVKQLSTLRLSLHKSPIPSSRYLQERQSCPPYCFHQTRRFLPNLAWRSPSRSHTHFRHQSRRGLHL